LLRSAILVGGRRLRELAGGFPVCQVEENQSPPVRPPVHELSNTVAVLARTPETLNALLRDLPAAWTHQNEGGDTWSALTIVGHLVDGEASDWMPRVNMILQFGESKTFVPFDRAGYEKALQGRTLPQLLDEFARLRSENLEALRLLKLRPEDLERRGKHPVFGSVTLSALLATWAAHDLTHLHQLSRVMAYQYRETVGPWITYLGVLHCQGHGASS
jgi:DinB family protein